MTKNNTTRSTNHDLLPEIRQIVRDAIADRLIRSETLTEFNRKVRVLKGRELEEYLQRLWDEL